METKTQTSSDRTTTFNTVIGLGGLGLAVLLGCGSGSGSSTAPVTEPPAPAEAEAFAQPESAAWDAGSQSWYVSNIAGQLGEKDGRGWITRLDADGRVVDAQWVAGLNAPKGVAVSHGKLYVADLAEVAIVDIAEARIERRLALPGAAFLNDVEASDEGTVFVSDTIGNRIFRIRPDHHVEVFAEGPQLLNPNGLLIDGDRLIVAGWGEITDPATFATEVPGHLLAVDLGTREISDVGSGDPIGNLDGLEKDGDGYLATDWVAGRLLRIDASGHAHTLREGFAGSADLGWDPSRRLLVLPEMMASRVHTFALPAR